MWTDASIEEFVRLNKICNGNNPTKMILIRSKKEAVKYYSKLKKDFFIQKN